MPSACLDGQQRGEKSPILRKVRKSSMGGPCQLRTFFENVIFDSGQVDPFSKFPAMAPSVVTDFCSFSDHESLWNSILEMAGDKKWADDPLYKEYKLTTPVLIPIFGRKGNASW